MERAFVYWDDSDIFRCDGNVGMIGISWGGFNGLQLAARRPPALKAIVTCCSTVDRHADDIHYMGGCLLTDNFNGLAGATSSGAGTGRCGSTRGA